MCKSCYIGHRKNMDAHNQYYVNGGPTCMITLSAVTLCKLLVAHVISVAHSEEA